MTRWVGAVAGVAGVMLAAGALVAPGAVAAEFPPFGLPASPGQDILSAGLHSDDLNAGVRNAIDLAPTDDVVLAPLDGTVRFQRCSRGDWVAVDHEGGWRTGYYHLENIAVVDGQAVAAGERLGTVGNALPCGGATSGPHVHFSLWRLDRAAARSSIAAGNWDGVSYERLATTVAKDVGVSLSGRTFGGWTLQEGAAQYSGTATSVATGQVVSLPGSVPYAVPQAP